MYSLVYVSSAPRLLSKEELLEILTVSRRNNTRDDISGLLLYRNGNFMQVLEGERERVRALFERIGPDPRHRGVMELYGDEGDRAFPDWSMGFKNLGADPTALPAGYSTFLERPIAPGSPDAHPARIHRLLQLFRQNMGMGL